MRRKGKTGDHNSTAIIDEDRLLAYIGGTMPPDEQHLLEEILEEDPFLNDAVEGLSEIHDKEQLHAIAAQINDRLKKQIQHRRKHRRNRPKLTDRWGWIFVLIILVLVLTGWWVIKMMVK